MARRLAIVLLVCGATATAHADGELMLRGAYYKERSTRVEQPMIDASFDAGEHGRVSSHFLVDSITSASAATGSAQEFTENRYETGLDYTHELPYHIKIGAQGKYSTESDYVARWVGLHAEIALFEQNTTFGVLAGYGADRITNGIALEAGAIGTPARAETLDATLLSLSATQVFTPRIVGNITYDFNDLSGYQANVYRVVRGGAQPVPERVPDSRHRHAVFGSLRAYLPSRTTAVVGYRLYNDDWGITAHTPDVRVIQTVVTGVDLRARYRYYTQNAADFYKDVYTQAEVSDPNTFVTADAKLSKFETHTVGGEIVVSLAAFGVTSDYKDARLDLQIERIWQNNSFGDAWAGQLGVTIPFTY